MKKPKPTKNEEKRLSILKEYSILDTLPERDYDDITYIASEICDVPISLISLVDKDRQWFKSHIGLSETQTPRDVSFCAHAIHDKHSIMVVPDSRKDDRFKDNPLVVSDPNIVFYAGVPLLSSEGEPLGTICVIDNQARELSPKQIKSLEILSRQVMKLLELRRKSKELQDRVDELENHNKALERFSHVAAHDIKSPLNNILMLSRLLKDEIDEDDSSQAFDLIDKIQSSSSKLTQLIDGILKYSKNSRIIDSDRVRIVFKDMIEESISLLDPATELNIRVTGNRDAEILTHKIALQQIFINLFSNSIKYNDKERVAIEVRIEEEADMFVLFVQDNGPGINASDKERIFKLFETLPSVKGSRKGTGIGLATVKSLIDRLGGRIEVVNGQTEGATFKLEIPK